LPWERTVFVQLPVGCSGTYEIIQLDSDVSSTSRIQSIVAHPLQNEITEDGIHQSARSVLNFKAEMLPPVGAKAFLIRKAAVERSLNSSVPGNRYEYSIDDGIVSSGKDNRTLLNVSNGHISVQIDTETGQVVRIGSQAVENLTKWGYYPSFDWKNDRIHDNDHQNSGAYIFRPKMPNQELQVVHAVKGRVVNSTTGVEVHVTYDEPWIKTITRLLTDVPYIEVEYQVGPIPTQDLRGKEVVVRYNTMIDNNAVFFTDSNGREFVQRQRNYRPTWDLTVYEPVAGNYYPVNAALYVEGGYSDGNETSAFAVVTDRSQGGSSIRDGTVELMVHRRTIVDDWRGVDEPIDETDVGITPNPPWGNASRIGEGIIIKGIHRILVPGNIGGIGTSTLGGASLARSVMDETFAEPLVFAATASPSEDIPFHAKSFSGLEKSLPKNVMLITKQVLYDEPRSTYLVRLAHQYGVGEHTELSLPVDVSMDALFPGQIITRIQETTLSGNLDIAHWKNRRYKWIEQEKSRHDYFVDAMVNTVKLQPMDIRTFKVTVK
jgi:hypothetical protein